jgi:hypothetical protein
MSSTTIGIGAGMVDGQQTEITMITVEPWRFHQEWEQRATAVLSNPQPLPDNLPIHAL